MEKTEANPYPHNHIRLLADRWAKTHPGYRVEFVKAPPVSAQYRAWCVSNFVGETIPDIIYQNMGVYRDSDFQKGWVLKMDPFLEKPNPYVEGNTRWLDLFYEPWIDAMRSLDGNCYWVSPDTVGVGLLYSKSILAESGVEKPPETFGELMEACRKVREAGYLAYYTQAEWYSNCVVPSVIWADLIPEMDVNGNRIVNQPEMARAIEKGIFKVDGDRFREFLRLFYELTRNYPKGHSLTRAYQHAFKKGQIAFMEGLSVHMRKIEDDPLRDFAFGVIPFPEITKEDSRYGGAPLAGKGNAGYTSTWQITYVAEKRGVLDACVDWLMFLTAPENAEFLVNELGFTLPGVKGANPVPLFQALHERATKEIERAEYLDWHAFNPFTYTVEFGDQWGRVMQSLILDAIDIDEAVRRTDFWLERSHKRYMRKFGEQWGADSW